MSDTAVQTDIEQLHNSILEGIPSDLPKPRPFDDSVPHAPKRKEALSSDEKKLALRNALRYFPEDQHAILAPEFAEELKEHGRILSLIHI